MFLGDFFSEDSITTLVNFIVIVGALVFLFYIARKFISSSSGDKLKNNIKSSSSYQNIFGFASVIVASTLFNLFVNKVYNMMWVVLIISILTIIFNILFEAVSKKEDLLNEQASYDRGMSVIDKIINCKGYNLIAKPSELVSIENKANEIFIFAESLITDIPLSCLSDENHLELKNAGLFSEIVDANIPSGKKYTYFLKEGDTNVKYIQYYRDYHFRGDRGKFKENVTFYLIKEEEFCFFSDIYLYKNPQDKDRVFEWLPSIGEENNPDKQFYLELSSTQVQSINEIICELMISNKRFGEKDNVKHI